jgi:uncharacterized membrane-anchored protein
MRFPLIHREPPDQLPGIIGQVRLGPSTREVLHRLNPGDIAVLDAVDLDLVTAEAVVTARAGAVVNLAQSISGRYPALGARRLMEAGLPLLDDVGRDVVGRVNDGDVVRLNGRELLVGSRVVAEGELQTAESVERAYVRAQDGLSAQLEAFSGGVRAFLDSEHDLVLDGDGVPPLDTELADRAVLVVSRGPRDEQDVRSLSLWIREQRPVLVGVGAGADVLLRVGYRPDLVIGDMEDVSDEALDSGAELVVHGYRDGRFLGLERARQHHIAPTVFASAATSEDLALLLCIHSGASLVVTAGTADDLVELLDRDRSGLASTVVTRLRAGGILVDARGVAALYRSGISSWQIAVLLIAGVATLAAAVLFTPVGQDWLTGLGLG